MALLEGLRRATAWVADRFDEGLASVERPVVTRAPDLGSVLDLSSCNAGPIDWAAVRASGVEAVYVRSGLGLGTPDTMAPKHVRGALSVGLDVGLYQVLYPRHGRAQDAAAQAAEVVALHRSLGCTLYR